MVALNRNSLGSSEDLCNALSQSIDERKQLREQLNQIVQQMKNLEEQVGSLEDMVKHTRYSLGDLKTSVVNKLNEVRKKVEELQTKIEPLKNLGTSSITDSKLREISSMVTELRDSVKDLIDNLKIPLKTAVVELFSRLGIDSRRVHSVLDSSTQNEIKSLNDNLNRFFTNFNQRCSSRAEHVALIIKSMTAEKALDLQSLNILPNISLELCLLIDKVDKDEESKPCINIITTMLKRLVDINDRDLQRASSHEVVNSVKTMCKTLHEVSGRVGVEFDRVIGKIVQVLEKKKFVGLSQIKEYIDSISTRLKRLSIAIDYAEKLSRYKGINEEGFKGREKDLIYTLRENLRAFLKALEELYECYRGTKEVNLDKLVECFIYDKETCIQCPVDEPINSIIYSKINNNIAELKKIITDVQNLSNTFCPNMEKDRVQKLIGEINSIIQSNDLVQKYYEIIHKVDELVKVVVGCVVSRTGEEIDLTKLDLGIVVSMVNTLKTCGYIVKLKVMPSEVIIPRG